jgi:hypothetical protein
VHYETTGPEIWDATEGKVDILISGGLEEEEEDACAFGRQALPCAALSRTFPRCSLLGYWPAAKPAVLGLP